MARSKKTTRRKSNRRSSVAFGSFLKRSKSKGKSLITVGRHGGRKVYRVKGLAGKWFAKLGSAKAAANKRAYKRRR